MKALMTIFSMIALFLFSSAYAAGGANSGAVNSEQLKQLDNKTPNPSQENDQENSKTE